MKFKWNNKYFKIGLTAFLVICSSILFYYLLFHGAKIKDALDLIYDIMMPVFFGVILAYLLAPTLNKIEQRLLFPLAAKVKCRESMSLKKTVRGVGICLTVLFYFLIIQMIFSMLLSQIIPSIESIVRNSDAYYKNITNWLNDILSDNPALLTYINDLFAEYSQDITTFFNDVVIAKTTEVIKTVSLSVLNILNVLWNFILGLIISIYLLVSKEKFANQAKKITYAFMNTETANVVINNVRFTHNTFISFIGGKIIDSMIIGILCFIGTFILNTPYAALVSVIVGITNIIPFFGPFLGAIPSAILVLVVDPMHPLNCVYFVLFILFLQQLDGNFIGPKILGESTGLSSFWVIFAITVFGGIFGITGMIIGVPTFAVIYAVVKSFVYINLKKKNLPTETEAFDKLEYVDESGLQFMENTISKKKKGRKNSAENKLQSEKDYIVKKMSVKTQGEQKTNVKGKDVQEQNVQNKKVKDWNEQQAKKKYRSGDQFICSVEEWNLKYYKIDCCSQNEREEETEDEVCDSESETCKG